MADAGRPGRAARCRRRRPSVLPRSSGLRPRRHDDERGRAGGQRRGAARGARRRGRRRAVRQAARRALSRGHADRAQADAVARAIADQSDAAGPAAADPGPERRDRRGLRHPSVCRSCARRSSTAATPPPADWSPRGAAGALLDDPDAVAARAVRLVREGVVEAVDGTLVEVDAASLCLHGDSPSRSRWPAPCAPPSTRTASRCARRGERARCSRWGSSAFLLETDSLDGVLALHAALEAARPDGVVDLVPAARTVLVRVDPRALPVAAARAWALGVARRPTRRVRPRRRDRRARGRLRRRRPGRDRRAARRDGRRARAAAHRCASGRSRSRASPRGSATS